MPRATLPTLETMAARLKEVAAGAGRPRVPLVEFVRQSGITKSAIRRRGGYKHLLHAAGLDRPPNAALSIDELMRSLRDDCLAFGGVVPRYHAKRHGRHSLSAYERRWGNWHTVQTALRHWAAKHDPDFPYLKDLPGAAEAAEPRLRVGTEPALLYGAPLDYPGLRNEPVNESGVILLFGAMAHALGFAVERVSLGYPDCEAKRRLANGWQRVRIEFEFQSRNFRQHRHDPALCDLIVCWQHNWPEAPLEVLELKAEIAKHQPRQDAASRRSP